MKRVISITITVIFLMGMLPAQPAAAVLCRTSFEVTNTDDNGPGSLRQALTAACPGDTITFNASLSGLTISLTSGQLTLARDVTIDGSALASQVSINPHNMSRVFWVKSGVTATLNNLRLTQGYFFGDGGGIYNLGDLTLTNVLLINNSAYDDGGAIYNFGTLEITNSSIEENEVNDYGGGIYNLNDLTLTNVSLINNLALKGGAIYNADTLAVTNSGFEENEAHDGGGIFNDGGDLTITTSNFETNSAVTGGGINNAWYSTMSVINSTFTMNNADGAGGIFNELGSTATVTGSTLSLNDSWDYDGGGIANEGELTVVNSTIAANYAYQGWGGGIFNNGTLTLKNCTLSGISDSGGSLANFGGTLHFTNTIIVSSTNGDACVNEHGTIATNINNLVEDGSCGASLSGDPMLADLADNGGPTWTMALLAGSPAIDAGDDTTCAAAPVSGVDQRGVTRPQGAHCDIGAYEKVIFTIFLPMIFR